MVLYRWAAFPLKVKSLDILWVRLRWCDCVSVTLRDYGQGAYGEHKFIVFARGGRMTMKLTAVKYFPSL